MITLGYVRNNTQKNEGGKITLPSIFNITLQMNVAN